jgi:colicin import membrane protein
MSAQSPGAYGMSVLLHGAVVLLIGFFSYAASNVVQDSPKILELVAGAGDNYRATEAPALGSPGGVKVQAMPLPPAEKPRPAPVQPAPIEAAPAEAAPKAPAKPAATAPAKPVDLVKSLNRVEERRKKRLEDKYKKEEAAEQKREELERKQAARVAHIDAEGIREGVIGGSAANKVGGAGGKALTREEANELDEYFSLLKARIKENHTPPEGVSDALEARLEFFVAADGSLSHFRIVASSGNHEFDRSVIEACERTRSIGPRPDGRSETVQMTFKMREDEPQ